MKNILVVYCPGFSSPVHCKVSGWKYHSIGNYRTYELTVTAIKNKTYPRGYKIDTLALDIFDSASYWKRTGKLRCKGKEWTKKIKEAFPYEN